MTKSITFLNTSVEQVNLFETITEDVNLILARYNLKKHTEVKQTEKDTIKVTVQETIPTSLVLELNEYFGIDAELTHDQFNLILQYHLKNKKTTKTETPKKNTTRPLLFEIIQELSNDMVEGELLDNTDVSLGYTVSERLAQSFCEKYPNCKYQHVPLYKYRHELLNNFISEDDPEDIMLLKIAVKKPDM